MLTEAKVAWRVQTLPEHVGVHQLNRPMLGVGGSESHHHGAQILQARWSWQKCNGAPAVECPRAPRDKAVKDAND